MAWESSPTEGSAPGPAPDNIEGWASGRAGRRSPHAHLGAQTYHVLVITVPTVRTLPHERARVVVALLPLRG